MIRYASLLLLIGLAYNQGWMRDYGDNRSDYGCCIATTEDGNYLFVGETSFPSTDVQPGDRFVKIYKVNPLGNLIWEDSLDYEQYEQWEPHIIQSLGSGYGYLITGSLTVQVGENEYEGKEFATLINSNGNQLSTHIFDTFFANEIMMTNDNNYIATGSPWLYKLDSLDNVIWVVNSDVNFNGNCLYLNQDGSFIVTGEINQPESGGWNLIISKVDSDGNEEWIFSFDNQNNDERGYDVTMTQDSGYVVAARLQEYNDWPAIDTTYAGLFKLSSEGELEWYRKYGGGEYYYSEGKEIAVDNDGNIILAGRTKLSQVDEFDLYIIKVNTNGDLLYERVIQGSPYDEKINHIIVTPNDKVLTAGHLPFSENQGGWNHWIANLNSDGLACISDSNQDGLLTNDDFEFLVERTLQNIFYEELYDWNYDSKNNIVDILRMSDYLYGFNPFNYNCYY